MIHPIILSGGSGTRLWPMSRTHYPKQFLPLAGENSLLQQAALRVAGVAGFAAPLVIANEEHRFLIAEQLREIGVVPQALLLEPVGRNTAPAIAVAALRLIETGADALMLVMPSDHTIDDSAAFCAAVERAAVAHGPGSSSRSASSRNVPRPAMAISSAARRCPPAKAPSRSRFFEKPDAATAARYVASGEFFWPSRQQKAQISTDSRIAG